MSGVVSGTPAPVMQRKLLPFLLRTKVLTSTALSSFQLLRESSVLSWSYSIWFVVHLETSWHVKAFERLSCPFCRAPAQLCITDGLSVWTSTLPFSYLMWPLLEKMKERITVCRGVILIFLYWVWPRHRSFFLIMIIYNSAFQKGGGHKPENRPEPPRKDVWPANPGQTV